MENQLYKYGKDIVWSLPVMFQYEAIYGAIQKSFAKYDIILPQINAFGSPTHPWAGGRVPAIGGEFNTKMLLKIFNYLNEINATPSFTFTCTQITKEDLKDKYANYFLDIALEAKSHFIIYSDLLKDYIKEKDPNAYVVASVIKPSLQFQGPDNMKEWSVEKETNLYNKLLKEYDMVVVRPEYSKGALLENPNLIDDISRIEVLINQPCIQNCPRMPQHYRYLESMRLGTETETKFKCIRSTLPASAAMYKNTLVHTKQTIQKLVDLGVKHLKVQGRSDGIVTQSMALMLFSQIFNVEGPSYLIYGELLHGAVEKEVEYFKELLKDN